MKNKLLLLCFCLNALNVLHAQSKDSVQNTGGYFTKVEREAKFPGGRKAWIEYLTHHLNADLGDRYIKLQKDQQKGSQTVKVQFIVDTTGSITNVLAVNKDEVHPKLAAEAIRVISKSPLWIPAEQGGRKVNYRAIQNITFNASASR